MMLGLSPPLPSSTRGFIFIPNTSTSSSSSSISCCLSPASAESKIPPSSIESPISNPNYQKKKNESSSNNNNSGNKNISQIQVSREEYIPVSKSQLHDSLLSFLRSQHHEKDDEDEDEENSVVSHFLLLSSCLDSILHAEHKSILEEMRADYFSTHSVRNEEESDTIGHEIGGEADSADSNAFVNDNDGGNGSVKRSGDGVAGKVEENQLPFLNGLDLMQFLGSSMGDAQNNDALNYSTSEVAAAARFQQSFMKLLQDAQFEELSVRDLMLTAALNNDYLLTLPIYVDWKKASDSNAIIFRRGYCSEKQKGLLIVEKLDYLQSKVLQEIFGLVSKPLVTVGLWIKEALQQASEDDSIQVWIKRIQLWIQDTFQKPYSSKTATSDAIPNSDQNSNRNLPIWLAAQEAVSRYEGFLSSIGPRSRLLRKFLALVGVITPTPEVPFEVDPENDAVTEPHLRPVLLSRISLSDIWRPATRKYCGNNVWRMLRVGFSIIFSRSFIQEPAFQELILLYTEQTGDKKMSSLQLKIYEKIPVPDLQVIFPHKKLSFRILDTVRLDIASVVGLLAYFINYRFAGVLSSPSDLLLDVIALSALIILVFRVALGYKQTRDRYELLVNRTLYEKTLASGFGSVHFLLDASEQQQYKECILAFGILLKQDTKQCLTRTSLGEECERFLYSEFKEKIQMPVDKAVDTLINFGLVLENNVNGKNVLQVVPGSLAYDALRKRWDCLLR